MTNSAHFTPALFEFLSELAENNSREWFQDNKARYERDVRDALVHFVADFGEKLHEISPTWSPTRGCRAGPYSAYTGMSASRRTRALTRPTPASTSATRSGATYTDRPLPESPAGHGLRRSGNLASELRHSGQDQGSHRSEAGYVDEHRQRQRVRIGLYAGSRFAQAPSKGNRCGSPTYRAPEAQVVRSHYAIQ